MTSKKIAQPKPRTKRAAKKGSHAVALPPDKVVVSRGELERLSGLLVRAQHEAISAAPRSVPLVGDGTEAAIRAYDTIRHVRLALADALRGAS